MTKIVFGFMVVVSLINSALAQASKCEHSKDIDREVSVENIRSLAVIAGAGGLDIRGGSRALVRIKARLCAPDKETLQQMDVTNGIEGQQLRLETQFANTESTKAAIWSSGYAQATIELELEVPSNLPLTVKDSSGAAKLEGVASLHMVDSSGELEIGDVAGDVDVKDSSGAIEIAEVGGSVAITDSSGGIEVQNVAQDLLIRVDSSGGIDARDIGGSVVVKADSSGDIKVKKVGGNFTVGSDTSGIIYHDDVAGTVSLPN